MHMTMKKIQLTKNKYALVDDEDYEELNKYNWYYSYQGYAVRTNHRLNKCIYMHRIIMNPLDYKQVDHINHNKLDNRKENLRICDRFQNLQNSKIRLDNKSGIKGVSWNKRNKKWVSNIQINGKQKHLGYFISKLEAKIAYEIAAKYYFGEFYSNGIRIQDEQLQKEIDNIKLDKKEKLYISNTSGIRGVSWDKSAKKWRVDATINSKKKNLGYFSDRFQAKNVYEKVSS